jgi:NAD(P)-dependent dehydrogenase (short-subunit alcohol dehydrogenase family)
VHGIAADLSREDECLRLAAELAEHEAAVHLLINNAGATADGRYGTDCHSEARRGRQGRRREAANGLAASFCPVPLPGGANSICSIIASIAKKMQSISRIL